MQSLTWRSIRDRKDQLTNDYLIDYAAHFALGALLGLLIITR